MPPGIRTTEEQTMSRQNYFNTLTMAQKLDQLGRCRFMDRSEFNGPIRGTNGGVEDWAA